MSRDFKFKSLQEIISAPRDTSYTRIPCLAKTLKNYQPGNSLNMLTPKPAAVYSGPIQSMPSPSHFSKQQDFSHSSLSRNVPASSRPRPNQHHSNGSNFQTRSNLPTGIPSGNSGKSSSRPQGISEICNMFNKFKKSTCELPKNKCFYHCLHKCQACHKWGGKSCNQRPPGQVDFTKSKAKPQVASTIAASSGQSASCENWPGFPQSYQSSPCPDLTTILSSTHNSLQPLSVCMEKLERPPVPTPSVSPQLPQTQGLPLALILYCKFLLTVIQLSQQFPTTSRFRHWILQINTVCGPPLHLQGSPFPSLLIVVALCHWSVRLMLMSLL